MTSLPRKIEPDKIKGYVYCLDFGPLAYENEDDKQKLIALSELYREGIRSGGLTLAKTIGITRSTEKVTRTQLDAYNVLWKHGTRNIVQSLRLLNQMRTVAAKRKKEILVFTMKDVRKLGKGWFSWLEFWKK